MSVRAKEKVYTIHLLNDYSGSPRVLADAINAFQGAGVRCYLLTSQHQGFLNQVCDNRLVVPYIKTENRWLLLLSYLFAQMYCFIYLSFLLIKDRVFKTKTTVLVNTMLPFGACFAAKFFADKRVVYIHETSISPMGLKFFLRAVINFCADSVIYVSEYLAKVEPFERPTSCVLYNGLRIDLNFSIEESPTDKFERRIILFCGSLKEYKGIFQFIKLSKRMPDFRFVAALNCDVSELIEINTETIDNLVLISRPVNLHELYENAFLVVNFSNPSSWVETFGLSLLEGMAAGCPVIAPPIGGPVELVSSDVGVCIDSSDLDSIESYIQRLGRSYDFWHKCSVSALNRSKLFSADVYRRNILHFFNFLKN